MSIFYHATQRTQSGYQAEDTDPVERGIMSKLDDFMQLLCGEFDTREQFEAKQAAGETFTPCPPRQHCVQR